MYAMEYYGGIKGNTLEAALMRWMNLASIIPCAVSQKEENRRCLLSHMYGIWKDGSGDLQAPVGMQTQSRGLWAQRGTARVGRTRAPR